MAISDLIRVAPPPARPLHTADNEACRAIESFLGTALPADYLDLGRQYGTGTFGDQYLISKP
jgi:hypothetical protein